MSSALFLFANNRRGFGPGDVAGEHVRANFPQVVLQLADFPIHLVEAMPE